MMSATPIFEQLCREILDAGRVRLEDGTQATVARQSRGPAHSLEETGGRSTNERGNNPPRILAGWACPAG